MAVIVTRAGKGSPLTNNEVDANFLNLNTELGLKALAGANSDITSMSGLTGTVESPVAIQMGNGSAVTLAAGKMWYNQTTGSWNLGMGGGNITQQIGEELFEYGKASAAITDSPLQIVYQTGTVGASGVITFAPTVAGITNGDLIIGVATENIGLNSIGRITAWGLVHGVTTNGTAYGETWADNDILWYNPVTGNPTNIKPSAPNIKVSIGTVVHAGSGGSGTFRVEINHGSVLGGTDSNVQLTSEATNDILQRSASGYWVNVTPATARTNLGLAIGANVQAWDADLDAIGALAGTSGFLKKTAANTWSLDTNTYLTTAVTSVGGTGTVSGLTLTGTVTSTGNLTLGGTLAVTASNFASQTANTFLAAPNGAAGVPTFRALVAADVPTLNQNTTGSSGSCTGNAATATTASALSSASWQRITGNGIDYGSYGSIGVSGTTNTYAGISFSGVSGTLMMNSGATGFYYSNSTWRAYWDGSGNQINTGNVTAYASDERLKHNVQPIRGARKKLRSIEGVYFDWDLDECNKWNFFPPASDMGVLAQRVQREFPHAVQFAPFDRDPLVDGSKSGKDYLTVQYEKLVPPVIQAVNEHDEIIDSLATRLAALEATVAKLVD